MLHLLVLDAKDARLEQLTLQVELTVNVLQVVSGLVLTKRKILPQLISFETGQTWLEQVYRTMGSRGNNRQSSLCITYGWGLVLACIYSLMLQATGVWETWEMPTGLEQAFYVELDRKGVELTHWVCPNGDRLNL